MTRHLRVLLLVGLAFTGSPPTLFGQPHPVPPALPESDRIRLAEALHLSEWIGDGIWPSWSETPFPVLIVTNEYEFLVGHPRPGPAFELVSGDTYPLDTIRVRPRQFSPQLRATFPAIGSTPTVVIGTAELTRQSSTEWVLTVLHEHFHQYQMTALDYYEGVTSLDLAEGDTSGMWMLNYPFPYTDSEVNDSFRAYQTALLQALDADSLGGELRLLRVARRRLKQTLTPAQNRYMAFQLWQEGVARYTEYKVAELAAEAYDRLESFSTLSDQVSYEDAAANRLESIRRELSTLSLTDGKRVAFYSAGAAEALILDRLRPRWRDRYNIDRFSLEHYYIGDGTPNR